MDPLKFLSNQLKQVNGQSPVSIQTCDEIDEVIAELEKRLRKGSSNEEPRDLQIEAVRKFWLKGEFDSMREARLVCFGLAVCAWNDRRCLMEDPERLDILLAGLHEWEPTPRLFRKCYQGLLRSYFDYDGLGYEGDVPTNGKNNWLRVQTYLREKAKLLKLPAGNPDWVECVLANKGLFSENPCATYAKDWLDGREDKVKQVRELLGISDASWFTHELVLSQIMRVCGLADPTFTRMVTRLLALLGNNEVLKDRGLRMLLNRYAQVPQTRQLPELKDYSVNAWGNPWLPSNDHQWGGVTEEARQMVVDWLKLELIELFFTKLAEDTEESESQEKTSKVKTLRRLEFWKQYVPLMSIHFALGTRAKYSPKRDFVELRAKMEGLTVSLEDSTPSNNAFIMTMGDLVAVEFSGESNAFYGYSLKQTLPFDLTKPVRSGPVNGRNSLKNDNRLLYLTHQDNILGYPEWEDRFKHALQDNFGLVPGQKQRTPAPGRPAKPGPVPEVVPRSAATRAEASLSPKSLEGRRQSSSASPTPASPAQRARLTPKAETYSDANLKQLAKRFNAKVIDNRSKGGALWLSSISNLAEAAPILKAWGFKYSKNKGWWKEGSE